MQILKYPPRVIRCLCGCVFSYEREDFYAIAKPLTYIFYVDCPVCEEQHEINVSKVKRPCPIENESISAMCDRVYESLGG